MKSNFSQYGHHVDGGNVNKIPRSRQGPDDSAAVYNESCDNYG